MLKDGNHRRPGKRGIDLDGQALLGALIDESKTADATAIGQPIGNEVDGPAHIGLGRFRQRFALDEANTFTFAAAYCQSRLP